MRSDFRQSVLDVEHLSKVNTPTDCSVRKSCPVEGQHLSAVNKLKRHLLDFHGGRLQEKGD